MLGNKRFYLIAILVIALLAFAGCDDSDPDTSPTSTKTPVSTAFPSAAPTDSPVLEKVELKAIKDLKVSGTLKVEFTTNLTKLPDDAQIVYTSSDTNIVKVSNDGILTAVALGSADISVKVKVGDKEVTDTEAVKVVENAADEYNFDDLELGTELYDDFNWNNGGTAEIVDADGNKVLEMSGGGYNFIFIGEDFEGDFIVETKFRIVNHVGRGAAQINFREDSTAFNGKTGYQACIGDGQNQEFGLELRKREGTITDIESTLFENDGNWHVIKIEMKNEIVTAYLDGNKILTHENLEGFDSGSIMIATYLDTVQYDYVKITK